MSNASSEWTDVQRVESWAGEVRVNLIRMLAILIFYGRHLADFFLGPADGPARGQYHVIVTALCIAWAAEAVVLHIWLSRRHVPPWLKYLAALLDVFLVTLLCVAAGGPKSPLVLLYFPVIASAPLRLSLKLVYTTTAATMLSYLFLLGYYAWYVVGWEKYYATPELRIPRATEAIMLLTLLTTGLFAGQIVRQMRRVVLWRTIVITSESPAAEASSISTSPGLPGEGEDSSSA